MIVADLAKHEEAAAAAMAAALPAAYQAGTAMLKGQDGAADAKSTGATVPGVNLRLSGATFPNITRVGGLLSSLRNISNSSINVVAHVRDAVTGSPASAQQENSFQPDRRTAFSFTTAQDPMLPSWLSTQSSGQSAEVYIRYLVVFSLPSECLSQLVYL